MTSHAVLDTAHWHALRAQHVGASEVAALFGMSPWITRWQLYMVKTGKLPDVGETLAMTQGKHFEPAVASYAAEKFGITLQKVHRYLSCDDTPGLGSSLDYEQIGTGTLIPCELKFSLWGDWKTDGDEIVEAPENYILQCQHQLACVPNAPHAMLIAFTGGDLKRMIIPRNESIIAAIKAEVTQFWADVKLGHEPPVDFTVDADAVKRLAYLSKLRSVVLPQEAEGLFRTWRDKKALADTAETAAEAAKAELLKMVVDSGTGTDEKIRVTCGNWNMNIAKIAENLGTEIKPEMVGTRYGQRKGYMRTTIVEKAK